MARRMISDTVIGSDKFLQMPLSAQALYFHYVLDADNAGIFASAISTMRRVGASHADLECLINNEYLLQLSPCVYAITHWLMHQTLKNDRKNSSYPEARMLKSVGGIYELKTEAEMKRSSRFEDEEE